ncbi:c-type cytochrome [Nonomuraea pusilla]|uniref:cytochrome bc1 complex diheme cytochrome c subunit n=1 Tax=Nonomuraea pusilla TaxID=46177 RepID=UPI00332BCEA4
MRAPKPHRAAWGATGLPRLAVAVAIAAAAPAATTGGPLDAPAASPAAASPAAASPAAAPPSPSPGGPARGRELFDRGCVSCHGQRGGGTQLGPDLTRAGAASADFQLSTGRMPLPAPDAVPRRGTPAFSRPDIDALTAYVASLGHGPAIPSVPAGDPRQGRRLYLATCAACHSSTGDGASLPGGQVAPSLLPSGATQIAEAVRLGPGAMPAFPPNELSDAQLGAVIAYLDGLRAEKAHGGAPLGGIGPVAEGAVAWLIGLGLLIVFIRFVGKKAP